LPIHLREGTAHVAALRCIVLDGKSVVRECRRGHKQAAQKSEEERQAQKNPVPHGRIPPDVDRLPKFITVTVT